MPELKGETVGVPGKDVQERDMFGKLKGKAYADLKRGATLKSIRVRNTVLSWRRRPSTTGRFCGTGG